LDVVVQAEEHVGTDRIDRLESLHVDDDIVTGKASELIDLYLEDADRTRAQGSAEDESAGPTVVATNDAQPVIRGVPVMN